MNRIVGITSVSVILVSIGVCLAQVPQSAVPFTVSKETTAIVEPLKGDGTVDYVAAINQLYGKGVTPENNGYVIWLRVVGTDALPASVRSKTLAILGVAQQDLPTKGLDKKMPDDLPERLWKAGDDPGVAAYLTANDKFLDLAVEASQKPMWWDTAVSPDGTMGDVLLPWLSQLRSTSRALCCRAMLRQGNGDFDGFVSDVMAVKRLSRLGAGWTMISRLVCANVDRMADGSISANAATGSLTAAQCDELAKAMDGIAAMPGMTDVIDVGERWSRLEMVAALATGRSLAGLLDTRTAEQMAPAKNRGDVDWDIVLRQTNQQADEVVAILRDAKMKDAAALDEAMRKNLVEIRGRRGTSPNMIKGAGESREAYSKRVADMIFLTITPNFAKSEGVMREARMRDEMVRALVAAAQFRADNSHWPGVLSDLVPKYLAAVPRDVYSPSAADAVRYLQSDAGVFIYSVGVNRVDDGGLNNPQLKQDDVGEGIVPKAGEQGL